MKKGLIMLCFLAWIGCGQETPIAPEPEKIHIEVEKPFEPVTIQGNIYWEYYPDSYIGNFPNPKYVGKINGVEHLLKARVAVEHHVDGVLEIVIIIVHFQNPPEYKIEDGPFQRGFIILNGENIFQESQVKIKLVKVLRLGVYEGVLSKE